MAYGEEDELYNTEVQNKNTGNLVKRTRFYQALIDSSLLEPGDIDYNKMPSAYQIMISPFDLFGEKKYCYTFQMSCREADGLWLEDGVFRIFLNTKGENPEEVSEELVELLHYFEQTSDQMADSSKSKRVKGIHQRISKIKASEEIGVRYMQAWEEKIYDREEARTEGLEAGRAEGLQQVIRNMIHHKMSDEEIMTLTECTKEQIETVRMSMATLP